MVPGHSAYAAAKGGLVSLTRSLAVEYGPDGIRANAVMPAVVRTALAHTPRFAGWDPGQRVFVEELSSQPVRWLRARLADPAVVLAEAGEDPADHAADLAALRSAAPVILETVERLLAEVAAGRAATPPDDAGDAVRASWL